MNNPLIYKDENGGFFLWTFVTTITDAVANVIKHGFNVSQEDHGVEEIGGTGL